MFLQRLRNRLGGAYQGAGLGMAAAVRAVRPIVPPYLIHFVTCHCNARCPFCFVDDREGSGHAGPELTLAEVEKIAEKWRGVVQVTLTGGEPFLREDLAGMVAAWARAGARSLTIASNGLLVSRITETVPALLAAHPRLLFDLDLSIDGSAAVHDRLRGEGSWDKVMAVARRLAPLQERRPGFRLGATLTVSGFNQETARDTALELTGSGLFRRVQALLVRGRPREPSALEVDLAVYDECRSVLDRVRSGRGAGRIKELLSRLVREQVSATAREDRLLVPCRAGETLVMLDPGGSVYPCEMLAQFKPSGDPAAGISDWRMGSLREAGYDIKGLMNSEPAGRVRRWIKESGCYCSFECAAYNNLVFSPRKWPAILGRLLSGR